MAETKISLPEGTKVPDHLAIVCDGNRRWARARGMDTLEGHMKGFQNTTVLCKAAREMGIHTLSLWGWSTENWDRSEKEINYIMKLFEKMVDKHLEESEKEGVRIIHLGRKDRLPKSLLKKLAQAEEQTKHHTKHVINICLDHGGKDDIVRAVNKYTKKKEEGKESREMDDKVMLEYLDTADQPYPLVDMVIRTSGEQRTSGMLLWQAAYSEIYWEVDHFPDLTPEKLKNAILDYSRRRRRFGGNDKEEHLKFKPEVLAKLELDWRKNLSEEKVIKYVKEQYGLSKDLAKTAGISLAKALVYREQRDWEKAKEALKGLYEIVKANLNLAMEPELVANIEIDLWNPSASSGQESMEQKMRKYYAELYRVSDFQATKVAHLATLAQAEMKNKDWEKAKHYSELFYKALKERVA